MSGRAAGSVTNADLEKRVSGKRGPNGRRLCKWCLEEVPSSRRRWCSQACVDAFMVQASPGWFRHLVWKRDKGVCALCSLDTDAEYKRFIGRRIDRGDWRYSRPEETIWEADHIIPICEGGTDSLENARTLCRPCHRKVTAELRRRIARAKREAVQPSLGFNG